jgi:hypothetical protein
MGFVFAHVGAGLPHHEAVMFLMPLLPALLVLTIVIAAFLDKRGHLGAPDRLISVYAPVAIIGATLSLAAAGIHFAVIQEHLEDGAAEGVFFFALGAFQVIWAQFFLLRDDRRIAVIGAAVNAGVIGIWLISRTSGLPFGATPWIPEPVGLPDLMATSFELGLIGLLLPRLIPGRFGHWFRGELPAQKAFVLASFTVVALTLLTAVALVPEAFEAVAFGA